LSKLIWVTDFDLWFASKSLPYSYFMTFLASSVAVGSVGVPMAAESTEILLVNLFELRICSKMALAMGLRHVFPSQTSRILFTASLLLDLNNIQINSKNVKLTK